MPIKVENLSNIKLGSKPEQIINRALEVIPIEHLRGLSKIVLVDHIDDKRLTSRLTPQQKAELPALYMPKLPGSQAYAQIAMGVILPQDSFFKRIAYRFVLKSNLTQVTFSLVGQHYYMTLARGTKKTQMEAAVKSYVEKYFKIWREKTYRIRTKLFKPIQPWLEKISKRLRARYEREMKKRQKA